MSMFTKIPAFFNLRRQQNRDREDGVTYQQTMTNRYTAPEVTAAKIRELEDNAYLVKLEQNQRNLIFCEKVEISVKGPDGEVDEELSKTVTNMCDAEDVRLNQKLIMVWSSVFRYGAAFVNDVWGWRGNEYRLLNLRILPSWTFADLPVSQTEYIAYGDILRGVVLNKNGDMEFWQKQSDTDNPVQVTNVTMITDPTEHAIAGTPGCLPAVHIINMLSYCHGAQMKKVNRVGAPSIFPKITEKVNRTAKEGGDASYLKTMLQNWGINVGFILRDNMEFADPHLPEESCALDTIKHYEGILDRIYSPTSMISKDGTLIGGSNLGELELMKMYISSVHRWLEEAAESILQHYLDVNRYADYTVEVTLPSFEVDETPLNIQRVTAMKATPTSSALATPDEMRELLGLPPMTDEIRAELQPVVKPPKEPPELEPQPFEFERKDAESGHWVTIQGTHVFIRNGESVQEAIQRATGKSTGTPKEEYTTIKANQQKFIQKYKASPIEHMEIFNDSGDTIAQVKGDDKAIKLPQDLILDDTHLIHNHPENGGTAALSPADISAAIETNMKSMTCIDSKGGVMTITRPDGGWPDLSLEQINSAHNSALQEFSKSSYYTDYMNEIRSGKLTVTEANKQATVFCIKETLYKLHIKYQYKEGS